MPKDKVLIKKVATITSHFDMDDTGEITYDVKIKGNVCEVFELAQKVYIECKKRLDVYRNERNALTDSLFNFDKKD